MEPIFREHNAASVVPFVDQEFSARLVFSDIVSGLPHSIGQITALLPILHDQKYGGLLI
jgi:hypothetical protein